MLHQLTLLSTGCLPHIHGSPTDKQWVELWGEFPLLSSRPSVEVPRGWGAVIATTWPRSPGPFGVYCCIRHACRQEVNCPPAPSPASILPLKKLACMCQNQAGGGCDMVREEKRRQLGHSYSQEHGVVIVQTWLGLLMGTSLQRGTKAV